MKAILIVALFVVAGCIQPLTSFNSDRAKVVPYDNPVDVQHIMECQFTANSPIVFTNPPDGVTLNHDVSVVDVAEPSKVTRFPGNRLQVVDNWKFPNDITVGFDGTIPQSDSTCTVTYRLVFNEPSVTTTTIYSGPFPTTTTMPIDKGEIGIAHFILIILIIGGLYMVVKRR